MSTASRVLMSELMRTIERIELERAYCVFCGAAGAAASFDSAAAGVVSLAAGALGAFASGAVAAGGVSVVVAAALLPENKLFRD